MDPCFPRKCGSQNMAREQGSANYQDQTLQDFQSGASDIKFQGGGRFIWQCQGQDKEPHGELGQQPVFSGRSSTWEYLAVSLALELEAVEPSSSYPLGELGTVTGHD